MAFYKKIGEDWFEANIVSNANYTLDINNKQEIDGWEWHDEPPLEYTDWLENQLFDDIDNELFDDIDNE